MPEEPRRFDSKRPWVVYRLLPNLLRKEVARCDRSSSAERHAQALRQLSPQNMYQVGFGIVRMLLLSGVFLAPIAYQSQDDEAEAIVRGIQNCNMVQQDARISRAELSRLIYIAPGNSGFAMRRFLGFPYCWKGNTEWFPMEADPQTWIGLYYFQGVYQGYTFSADNYNW